MFSFLKIHLKCGFCEVFIDVNILVFRILENIFFYPSYNTADAFSTVLKTGLNFQY